MTRDSDSGALEQAVQSSSPDDSDGTPPNPEQAELRPDEEQPEPDLVGTIVAERYQILSRIGEGGMGCVYLAEHVHMQKQVALKVLHREMTVLPEVVARFEREAVAAGRINHPNVAVATDFGRLSDGAFYLVLEYIEGHSLAAVLPEEPIATERALYIGGQIAEALVAAHAAGIVHRDLKPDNVMLIERPGEPELVKVLDFGIAKVNLGGRGSGPITRTGTVFGTPEYMAPEQAAGQDVDGRADLYALGVLLYRMLTGREPFKDEDVRKVLMQQITQPIPPLPAELEEDVSALLHKLLEKEASDRVQTAEEALNGIVKCLGRGSIAPPPAPTRMHLAAQKREQTPKPGAVSDSPAPLPVESSKVDPVAPARTQLSSEHREAEPLSTREALSSIADTLDDSPAGRPMLLFGRPFAMWRVVSTLGLTAFLLGGVGVFAFSGDGAEAEAEPVAAAEPSAEPLIEPSSPELDKLLSDVILGKKEAIAELERRPRGERSLSEWLALARGLQKLDRAAQSLEAYREAMVLDANVAANPEVAKFVWQCAQRPEVADQAVRVAAAHLGERGADLLYAVWVDLTKEKTPVTQLAKQLVYKSDIRKLASPALSVALDLRIAKSCDDYGTLLQRAILHGDERSMRLLYRVQKDKAEECGLAEETLTAAMAAVKERPGPYF